MHRFLEASEGVLLKQGVVRCGSGGALERHGGKNSDDQQGSWFCACVLTACLHDTL